MSKLAKALDSGKFVVTAELNPPKGTDLSVLFEKAEMLKNSVKAFNLTDSASATMSMVPMAAAHLLMDRDIEPILQVTCRDRNRIALQSDLLGANAMGVPNILCMSGDSPSAGDHPDAKPVFDMDAISLLKAITKLQSGVDQSGNELVGSPTFYVGAVANPGATDMDKERRRMEEKIEAGAEFFQTQAVYDPDAFERFMNVVQGYNVPILAGFIMLKSGNMARNLNANLPGVFVPDEVIHDMDKAIDRREKSVELSGRIINQLKTMCQGVHIMAIGWESRIPQVLQAAGIEQDE